MKAFERPDELSQAYEDLRAQATGQIPSTTPRGLALFLAAGLPVWMKAWAPLTPVPPSALRGDRQMAVGLSSEVARLLTEMALGCQRRRATT